LLFITGGLVILYIVNKLFAPLFTFLHYATQGEHMILTLCGLIESRPKGAKMKIELLV